MISAPARTLFLTFLLCIPLLPAFVAAQTIVPEISLSASISSHVIREDELLPFIITIRNKSDAKIGLGHRRHLDQSLETPRQLQAGRNSADLYRAPAATAHGVVRNFASLRRLPQPHRQLPGPWSHRHRPGLPEAHGTSQSVNSNLNYDLECCE